MEDVIEYLRNQDEPFINFTNLKKAATDLWIVYSQAKSYMNKDTFMYTPGPLFEDNFRFILQKIASPNLIEKEMGMYLLCNMRMIVAKVPVAKQTIVPLISQYILPQLSSPELLLRARANDVYTEFGK